MKFNMMEIIRKSLLVSFMLGSSAFVFNNVCGAATSTSSSSAATEKEAAAVQKWQKATAEAYQKWLETDAGKKASQEEKNAKNQELANAAYGNLEDSEKKLVSSYAAKMQNSSQSSSSNNSNKKSSSSSKTTTNTKKSDTTASAKTKTGDPCNLSMLGMSLFGSLGTCVLCRKKY